MSSNAEVTPTTTTTPTTAQTPTTPSTAAGGSAARSGQPVQRRLRTMSFSDGADTLAPRENAGSSGGGPLGAVQMREGDGGTGGTTTESTTSGGAGTGTGTGTTTEGTGAGTGTTTASTSQAGGTGTQAGTTTDAQGTQAGAQGTGTGTQAGGTTETSTQVQVPPHIPQPIYRDPTRDPTFRQNTLRWANGQISRIRELMSYGVFDWAVTDSEATQAMQVLAAMPMVNRLVVIQELMSTVAGSRLFDNLPAGLKTGAWRPHYLAVAVVAGHTEVFKSFLGVEPFLDASADAPLLLRAMSSIGEADLRAYAAKKAHNDPAGENFSRWVQISPNPPKEDLSTRFTAALTAAQTDKAAQDKRQADQATANAASDERMRDPAFRRTITTLQGLLSYGVFDWAITDGDARQVFNILAGMSGADLRNAVVQLDRGAFMDRFLDNIPVAERYGARKITFLTIISARAPERNVRFVREMLTTGIFHWSVSSEEAHLAFTIVKTMPVDVQRAFQDADNGTWWHSMEGSLDQKDANDRDAHLYNNPQQQQQLLEQFKTNCGSMEHGQLQAQLEMLCRMGKDQDVYDALKGAGVLARSENAWMAGAYGFAPAQRDMAAYQAWITNRGGDRADPGFFARAGAGVSVVGGAIGGAIAHGVTGSDVDVNLNDAQTMMGGALSGAVMAAPGKEGDNHIQIGGEWMRGHVTLRGQQLNIASYSSVADGTTTQTGAIAVTGIDVDFKWPTERDPSSYMKIKIPQIMARDIAIMTRDAMWTVGGITVQGLNIEAQQPRGTAPTDGSQGRALLMGEVERTVQKLFGMIRGANPQPDQIASQLTGAFSELSAQVRVSNISAERIAGSDGTYVGSAEVKEAAITVNNSRKGPTIRARLAELATTASTRPLNSEEQNEKTTLETNLVQVTALETEETNLARHEAARDITPADRDRLAQIRSELTITRATVTVAELNVRNVNTGGMHADDAHMGNLRIEADGQQRTGAGAQSDAHAEVQVGEMSAHGVKNGATSVGDVSGSDIHASVTTNAQGTNANLHVGAIDVTGAQQGTQGGGDMHMRGMDIGVQGGPNLLTAGADLAGQEIGLDLRLANLSLNNMHFASGTTKFEAAAAGISDFAVNVKVRVVRDPQGAYSVVPLTLNNFDVGRLSGTNIHIGMPIAGEQADINVPQAAIVGLHASHIPLENFDPLTISGAVSVESIQTQVNAQIGPHFQAHGSMSVSDLRMEALQTGAVNLHLGDLSFENLGFTADNQIAPDSPLAKLRGAGGNITRLGGIRGDATVDRASGAVTFDVGVGDFNMENIHYAGGGMDLGVTGARMTGATMRGHVDPPAAAVEGQPAPSPNVVIDELKVPKIQGTGIHYTGGGANVTLARGYLEDIRVRNFNAATQAGDFHLGAAGVEGMQATVTQHLAGAGGQRIIHANASARVSGIDVSRANNGRMTFSIADLSGSASGSMNQTDANGATTANVSGNASANVHGVSGTVGADGSTTANVGSASVDAHVSGSGGGMSGNVDAHVDAHGASVSSANGNTTANLGSANAHVSGNVTGGGMSGAFNLDVRNLGANVSITPNGFAATVTLGSASLQNTRFSSGDKLFEMARGAQLSGVNVRVEAQTTAAGIGAITVKEISLARLSADQLHVIAGRLEMSLDHAHIDGFSVTGLNISSKGAVTGGHIAVNQINASALQAQLGSTLEAHGGGFTASGMSLDMLGNDQFAFKLADVEAHAIGASGGTQGASGGADLDWLRLHGIAYDSAAGQATVQSAGFGVSAHGSGTDGGRTAGGTTPGHAATGIAKRYDLPFLSTLGGQIGLDIPVGSDRVAGALVANNGHLALGPTISSIHLPGQQYWGWAPGWLVDRMVVQTAGYIVDYFNPKFTEIRHNVEKMLADDGSQATPASTSSPIDLNAQTLSRQLVDKMGSYATALDVASPTGPGVLSTARREVGTWITDHNPLNPDRHEDAQARRDEDRDRHVQEIVDWVRLISLNIDLNGNGGFTAFETPPAGNEHAWLSAMANAGLSGHGNLASEIRVGLHVGLSNLNMDIGSMNIQAQTASVDTNLGASASSGNAATGQQVEANGHAGVVGTATGITVRLR